MVTFRREPFCKPHLDAPAFTRAENLARANLTQIFDFRLGKKLVNNSSPKMGLPAF